MFLLWHEENNTQDYIPPFYSDSCILNHPEAFLINVSSTVWNGYFTGAVTLSGSHSPKTSSGSNAKGQKN